MYCNHQHWKDKYCRDIYNVGESADGDNNFSCDASPSMPTLKLDITQGTVGMAACKEPVVVLRHTEYPRPFPTSRLMEDTSNMLYSRSYYYLIDIWQACTYRKHLLAFPSSWVQRGLGALQSPLSSSAGTIAALLNVVVPSTILVAGHAAIIPCTPVLAPV